MTQAAECSEQECHNKVPGERLEAGYTYCTSCSKSKPNLRKAKAKEITLDGYDVEELRRAW